MKKITFLIALFLMTISSMHAQLYTLPDCSALGSTLYGPMYSTSSANSTNRTAVIYPSSQLGTIAGQVINGMYFNRSTTGVTMAGTPNFKIYIKETTAVDFGAGTLDWATATTGTTLVYDSNPASIVGSDAGWKLFPLSTNFTYSGTQNLAVFFEYTNATASSAMSWFYEYIAPCVDTGNNNTTKYSNNTTGVLPTSLASSNFRRPFIGFDFVVSCNAPLSVSTSAITTNSADVSWVAPTILPSNGYEYYLSTSNTAPLPATLATGVVSTGTSLALTSLTTNTNYYLWVRSVCDAGDKSIWKAASPFKTLCESVTDFVQNFDSSPTGVGNLPDCWSKAGTSANVYTTTGGIAPGSAPNRLYMNISTATTAFAILPPVSNLQANTHRLKFKAYATAINKNLNVGYFTDPTDETTFVLLQSYGLPSTAASTAQEFTLIPTTIPAGVSQLVMTTPSGVATTLYVDDVKWELNSSCVEPSQLTANQITNTSAQLSWVNGGPETTWEIQYGPVNFALGSGTIIPSVATNLYVLLGLTSNTSYHYYVRGVCTGPINSSWAGPFTFKTQCDEVTAYTENFDSYGTGVNVLPDCWSRGGTSTSTYITTGGVAPGSAPNRLYMFASGTANPPTETYAILPPVSNLQANTHRLKFKGYATIANRPLEIGYLTDASNVSSFVLLQEVLLPGTVAANAIEFQIIPGALPAGVKNLAIRNPGFPSSSTTAYLDDFAWEAIPSCTEPSELIVANITNASAQLAWTEANTATAWEVQYGAPGFVIGTGTIVPASTNPFVLTGLTENTNYVFYVRAVCSVSDSSPWTGPLAFKTQCNDVTAYTENFDSYGTGVNVLPDCWSRGGTSTSTYITTGGVAPGSAPNRLYMFASGTANPPTETYAILPPVSNLQANTHRLKFKAYATIANRFLEVGYLTNPSDVSTFQYIQEVALPGTAATTAIEFTIIPGALPAGVKNLVIKNPGFPGSSTTAYLDDFKWEAIPTCVETSELVVSNVSNQSAQLSWTEGGSATAWEVQYGAPGFVIGTGTIVPASSNPFVLTGLTENTNYVFYVRAVCSVSDSSPWTGPLAFKTQCNDVTEFTQFFEGLPTGTTSPMPDCWSKGGAGSTYVTTASVAPMSPANRLYMFASGTANPPTEAYAIMPPVSNLQANTHRLKFKAYATLANRFLEVGYLTNPSDVSTFQFIQEVALPGTAATTAIEFTIIPGALPAGVKNLVIKNPGFPGSSTTAYLDDFKWEAIPSCIEPTSLAVNAITNVNATLAWTESATATAWEIEYGAPGFVQGTGTIVPAATNPFVLTGLTENTNYVFYVRAVCSPTDSSYWTGPLAFKTLCNDVTEFVMNFEGLPTGSANPMPDCWNRLGTGSTYIITGSVAPMSPANRLYMFASGTATPPTQALAVMPPVSNLGAASHQLKFKAYCTTASRFIQLGYLTNPADASSFVLLTSFDLPATAATTALEFTYAPAALPVGVKNLAFRNAPLAGGSATIYIDDVSWNLIPANAPVCATSIVATPDAACGNFATTFTWDVTPGADGYNITIGTTPGGSNILNNINVGSNPSYSFSGNANTTYYYTIVPFNVVGNATGCVEQTFTTAINGCVCLPVYTSGVSLNDMMSNVVITGTTLSNLTGNSTTAPYYNYYTGQPNYTATLVEGTTYNVAVTVGSGGSQGVAIWIDFNDNLTFEESERVGFTSANIAASTTGTIQLLIPCNAPVGLHRMRVRNVFSTAGNTIDPCSSYTYGEVEDYDVTIAEIAAPTGDATQSITAATAADATIEDLIVVGTGIKWFASAADALANVNQLPAGSLITDGTTYYAVSSLGTCNSDALAVTANVTLSIGGFDSANFNYYPNPVTDILTLSYSNTISEVVVYNLLGQQLLTAKPNATQTQMDLSGLNAGTYLVKIASDEGSKTVKVVKN
jgi:hypothetical protein